MKVAFCITVRNRAHRWADVERAVRAGFAQTYAPMEIVLSDQGSTDGTLERLQALAAEYRGPNTVRVLSCPDNELHGMAGLNAHLCWLMSTLDCDVFLHSADDDYALPDRTARSIEAMERTGADMVGTAMYFAEPGDTELRARSGHTREGWVTIEDFIQRKVGGSSALAWRRSLWERVMPIPSLCGFDVWLTPMAALLGGFWYVNEPLHVYVQHADPGNTGFEGKLRGLDAEAARPIDEHRFFQTAGAYQWVLRAMKRLGVGTPDERGWIREAASAHYEAWLDVRTAMTVNRQAPEPFPI